MVVCCCMLNVNVELLLCETWHGVKYTSIKSNGFSQCFTFASHVSIGYICTEMCQHNAIIHRVCKKEHFPSIKLHPLLRQGVESVPQGCWSMLTSILSPVVSSWLDILWVVDHSWYTQETDRREKPSSVAVLTLKLVRLAPSTIPRSKALKSFVLPIDLLNVTHTQSMSQLSQGLETFL